MLHNLQVRKSPGATGLHYRNINSVSKEKYTNPPAAVKSGLLEFWADFIVETVIVLSRGERVSKAALRCLMHVADRMREAAGGSL